MRHYSSVPSWRARALIYFVLFANVLIFFHKPLFSADYQFPWDFRGVQLPLISFLADRLRAGHFALWNPYSYCGYPVFANIEACYFQPFILAATWIAAHIAPARLPQFVEWVVALHIFIAGVFSWRFFRALGAADIPAWAGAMVFETGGYFASRAEHIGAIMAVSWMPLACLAVWNLRERVDRRWLAALALALGMAVLGGFPQPAFAVFLCATVLALTLVALRMARWRLLIATAAGCILGIAFSAVIFIPTAQLTAHSVAMFRAGWLGTGGGILPQAFVSLVAPDHYRIFDANFTGPGDRSFLYLYSSLIGLALAVYALAFRRTRTVALLAIVAVFGAIFTVGENTALWRALYPLLPERVRIGIHPEYAYCIFTFALAGLIALGLDRIRARDVVKIAIGVLIAADLFVTGSSRPMNVVSLHDEPGLAPQAVATMRALTGTANPPWRIDNLEGTSPIWAVLAPVTRVPSADGVSPLALESIIQLRLHLHDGHPWGWYFPVDRPDSPVLDLLNDRYVMAAGDGVARLAELNRFRHVASLPGEEVFENRTAMPRFFLAHGENVPLQPELDPQDEVRTISYEPDALEVATSSRANALLVMSENNYPGWHAWLDGRETPIQTAEIAFRAVAVPAGTHRVRMEFHPVILWWSLALSMATGLALLALAFWPGSRLTPRPKSSPR